MNELDSTVDVLAWSKTDGGLTFQSRIELLPEGYHGPTRACDTVISKDGRFVYFANRDNDFLYSFRADPRSGALTAIGRSSCGGKIPRNFVLDPSERWMLVANQDSNLIAVFARNPNPACWPNRARASRSPRPCAFCSCKVPRYAAFRVSPSGVARSSQTAGLQPRPRADPPANTQSPYSARRPVPALPRFRSPAPGTASMCRLSSGPVQPDAVR